MSTNTLADEIAVLHHCRQQCGQCQDLLQMLSDATRTLNSLRDQQAAAEFRAEGEGVDFDYRIYKAQERTETTTGAYFDHVRDAHGQTARAVRSLKKTRGGGRH